jgi:hypothetical protein
MSDALKNPRIRELLHEVDQAEALHAQLAEQNADTSEVGEALDGLLRDLGRAVWQFSQAPESQDRLVPDTVELPTGEPEGFTNEVPDPAEAERQASWYADDTDATADMPTDLAGSLFDPGDLTPDEMTEIPESDPITPSPAPERRSDDDTYELETLVTMRRVRDTPGSPLARLSGGDEPTWRHNLDELLELLTLPDDFDAPEAVSVETSRVQWAANELETRLGGIPEEVQVCVVAMLAARAQHLRGRLDVDVGLRLSLDRLQRYRIQADLPAVSGLLATPRAETGAWVTDVRSWWDILRP